MSNLIFKVLHLALCLITFIRTAREASKSEVENTQIHQHLVHEMLKGCCNLNWNSPKRSLKAVTFLVSGAGATASHHPFQEFVNARYQVRDQTWRLIPIFFTSTHSANQIQLNIPKCQCNTNHTTMVDIKAMRYLLLNCWYRTAHRRWTTVLVLESHFTSCWVSKMLVLIFVQDSRVTPLTGQSDGLGFWQSRY